MTDTLQTAPRMIVEAQQYAARGWRVLPLRYAIDGRCSCGNPNGIADHDYKQGGKHPLITNWQNEATIDWAQIAKWWRDYPQANIGIATGEASGIFVLDVDPANGGLDSLAALEKEHGQLPRTRRTESGSGGPHIYFTWPGFNPGNSAGKLGAGLDIRANGGQVVAPPSVSVKGPYALLDDTEPVPAPAWLVDMLRPPPPPPPVQPGAYRVDAGHLATYTQKALQAECDAIVTAKEGTQNHVINRAAFNVGTLVGAGALSEGEAREALLSACRAGNHPDGRAKSAVKSGLTDGIAQPRTPWPPVSRRDDEAGLRALIAPDAGPPIDWSDTQTAPPAGPPPEQTPAAEGGETQAATGRGIVFTPASKIKLRRVRWLWDTTPEGAPPTSHGRVPMYSLALAAGFPGLGKSQFGVWMTARITTGTLPGELHGTPRAVVYAAAEDSWSMTIAPRLIAAGADMDLVFRVEVQDTETMYARLTLPVDTSLLGKQAEEHSVALLVMDPLLSFIDKGINDYKAAEVRQALEPLVAAADRHHFTILGLAHFTKSGAADPVSRVAGSGAFGQLIRALIAFAKEESDDGDTRFVMSLEKNNLGRLGVPSHNYVIQPVTVDTEEGATYVSRFVLGPETNTSVSDVMRDEANAGSAADKSERDEASEWLEDYLMTGGRAGEALPKEIQAAARAAGIAPNALKDAKRKLGVRSIKPKGVHNAQWIWVMPDFVVTDGDSEATE